MKTVSWSQDYPGIKIEGDDGFISDAMRDLNKICSKPIGKDLLTLLTKRCQGIGCSVPGGGFVLIRLSPGTLTESAHRTAANPDVTPALSFLQSDKVIPGTSIKLPGKGSGSIVGYNPKASAKYTQMSGFPTPEFVALAHELCHSLHHLSGGMRQGNGSTPVERFKAMLMHEEAHTVGIGPYQQTRISENAIRREWGITERTYYSKPGDCDNLPQLSKN